MSVIIETIKSFLSSFKKDPIKAVTDITDIKIVKTIKIPYKEGSNKYDPENEKPPILKNENKIDDNKVMYPSYHQNLKNINKGI